MLYASLTAARNGGSEWLSEPGVFSLLPCLLCTLLGFRWICSMGSLDSARGEGRSLRAHWRGAAGFTPAGSSVSLLSMGCNSLSHSLNPSQHGGSHGGSYHDGGGFSTPVCSSHNPSQHGGHEGLAAPLLAKWRPETSAEEAAAESAAYHVRASSHIIYNVKGTVLHQS